MELLFSGGKFVSSKDELNYSEVLDDFQNAETIRIITYNISKRKYNDRLLEMLKNTNADVQIITNIPSRMPEYYHTTSGNYMRSKAKENIQIYISKLNPDNFSGQFSPFFSVHNHAKLIGTENIVYIGSANYSNESADNVEAGVIIKDKVFINKLYKDFFENIKNESLSYFDENFNAFHLFVLSLYAKFHQHHKKLLQDLYTDYERTKMCVADAIFIDESDLAVLYKDLEELDSVSQVADDTFDELNDDYNDALEEMKERFDAISIDWLKDVISEDGSLYQLATFDQETEANDILQNDYAHVAYDEHLDTYAEKAVDIAAERFSTLHNNFSEESDEFLAEFEKILTALDSALAFVDKWKSSKINLEIDNT